MSEEREGFLNRWSRKKRTAVAPLPAAPEAVETIVEAPEEPEFDLSTLPDLESLTGDSNALAFLQKGVPEALKNAALRRIWSADVSIRDYIGPVEMGWDFNDPNGVPGFGPLSPDTDMAALLRQAIGEADPAAEVAQTGAVKTEVAAAEIPEAVERLESAPAPDSEVLAEQVRPEFLPLAAVDVEIPVLNVVHQTDDGSFRAFRRHGGALPIS